MHYHLITTDGPSVRPAVHTVATASEAERTALRAAMQHTDWAPKRYPGRTWKRGEVGVFLDRTVHPDRPPVHRTLSIVRCMATSAAAPDCLLRTLGVPALNLADAPAPGPMRPAAPLTGQRSG
jgi:hypothetical protein